MNRFNEVLESEFEKLKTEVQQAYQSSGMQASGSWGESVDIIKLPNGLRMVADGYILGRKPGKQPPSQAIEQWLVQKGIASKTEKEISTGSLAYLIARKIAREGWQPQNPHYIEKIITPQRITEMLNKAAGIALPEFIAQITTYFKPKA